MEYKSLGSTGMKVSQLCLGAMMFGAGGNRDRDESISIINTALDSGINFIDTADVYSGGESELIVGKAIAWRRDDIVLATKVHFPMGAGPNEGGNSRRWILRACEDSLRRLNTDYIDLYQIHRPDPSVDIDETLGAQRPRSPGEGSLSWEFQVPAFGHRRGAVDRGAPPSRAVRVRAAPVLDARSRH